MFSRKKVAHLIDPAIQGGRSTLERHHLFPRKWLEAHVTSDRRMINQIANYAPLEWPDNATISDQPPSTYVPAMRERFGAPEVAAMEQAHGLPEGWEQMDYPTFLQERRHRMATLIRKAYERLAG